MIEDATNKLPINHQKLLATKTPLCVKNRR